MQKQPARFGKVLPLHKMLYLLLTGGEPLLHSDFEQIYSGLAEMGILLTLNTNGTLIDERIVEYMEKNPPERVNITLYGCSDNTYQKVCGSAKGYKAAIHGVELLKKAKIPVCINTTFTRHNASDMEHITSNAGNCIQHYPDETINSERPGASHFSGCFWGDFVSFPLGL